MSRDDLSLIAHLMRRAGFGARYDQLEAYAAQGYDATVDWLLHPEQEPEVEEDIFLRYSPYQVDPGGFTGPTGRWIYRAEAWALTYFLIKTRRKEFLVYLNRVAKKTAFVWDEPETRLDEFRAAFGSDLKKLDGQFLKYVERLR